MSTLRIKKCLVILGYFGVFLGDLGCLWTIFRCFGGDFGCSWAIFGLFLGVLEAGLPVTYLLRIYLLTRLNSLSVTQVELKKNIYISMI